jgi:tRNA G18 (ribose-2'-O)-methylase SpoU
MLALKKTEEPELQKLGLLTQRLSDNSKNLPWDHRSFLNLMVPLERLLQKQLTDADLIHDHPDKVHNQNSEKNSIILIADHIRSAFNIGAFFRTADAFAIEKIFLTGYSPTPNHPAVKKTALGSQDFIQWQYLERTDDAIT